MQKTVTMSQVARRAGVSRSAVSAAFSDRATTTVLSPTTHQQILKAAAELGYSPNILSRSFIKQKSFLIGMLGREAFFLFALNTIKGIEDVLETTDYSLLTYYHGSWAGDQAKHLQKCLSRRVDGMIIVGAPEPSDGPNRQLIDRLRHSGMPIVQLYGRIFNDVPVVMMDDEQAGYLATRHLLDLGHRRIAHVTDSGYRDDLLPGTEGEAFRRCAGYVRAMQEVNLEPTIFTFERPELPTGNSNDYTEICAAPAKQLLAADERFTGVTTFNDYATIGLIHNLTAMGVNVPNDMSIVGYDNAEAGILMRPALTTIRPKLFELGRTAGELIVRMLEGKTVDDVVLTPELIVRGSTAAPRKS
ncbi:MAG: lacI [Phycisphaerales bacterium]|nr:lacI [Phycisphaerales bacterium]